MKKILSILVILVLILTGCTISSADDYYNSAKNSGKYTATISINCQTAVDYKDFERKNADILTNYTVSFNSGDTVFDVLKTACKKNKIQFEYEGSDSSVYIEGIDYLYEFDCGDLSGWQFSVNDTFPNAGCSTYEVKDGDVIRWLYTCDLGADIGNKFEGE